MLFLSSSLIILIFPFPLFAYSSIRTYERVCVICFVCVLPGACAWMNIICNMVCVCIIYQFYMLFFLPFHTNIYIQWCKDRETLSFVHFSVILYSILVTLDTWYISNHSNNNNNKKKRFVHLIFHFWTNPPRKIHELKKKDEKHTLVSTPRTLLQTSEKYTHEYRNKINISENYDGVSLYQLIMCLFVILFVCVFLSK